MHLASDLIGVRRGARSIDARIGPWAACGPVAVPSVTHNPPWSAVSRPPNKVIAIAALRHGRALQVRSCAYAGGKPRRRQPKAGHTLNRSGACGDKCREAFSKM